MRYQYEPAVLTVSEPAWGDDETDQIEDIEGFKIFDSRVGHTEDAWVAFTRDRDMAGTIMNLLNANDDTARKDTK